MLDPFSPRARRALFALTCVTSTVILFTPPTGVSGAPPGTDKVVHLALFAALALTGLRARVDARVLLPCLLCYAPVSEVLQHLLPLRRNGDPADAVADLCGLALGCAAAVLSRRVAAGRAHQNSLLRVSNHRRRAQDSERSGKTGSTE